MEARDYSSAGRESHLDYKIALIRINQILRG
jgi:hypothetical protein